MDEGYLRTDTIAAIATSPNAMAAIGIIRISGSNCLAAAERVFRPESKRIAGTTGFLNGERLERHRLYRGIFIDKEGEALDDGLFVYMPGPHSFTGEDCCEFHLHGNPLLLDRMVESLIATGLVKPAAPGEFSFRAFRNGKLDLTQAEAVSDLIASRTPLGIKRALGALQGNVRRSLEDLKEELVSVLASVELDLDFSDQGVSVIQYHEVGKRIRKLREAIEQALVRFRKFQPLQSGIRTAIVGAPNSGKSTLFNLLVGSERSIVSDVAGTTRDVVREQVLVGNLLFLFSDTAGVRESQDAIESEGIRRSRLESTEADVVLLLLDGSDRNQISKESVDQWREELRAAGSTGELVVAINKCDLFQGATEENFNELWQGQEPVLLSAISGRGLEALEKVIIGKFVSIDADEGSVQIERVRHAQLLEQAVESLKEAENCVPRGEQAADLIAADLRSALDRIGEISGDVSRDDLLNVIFSRFCIGK